MGDRLEAFIDAGDLTGSIAERLEAAASASASEWWWTGWWDVIRAHYEREPFVTVLAALADTLRAGANPSWVVGSSSAHAAVGMAHAWLEAGVQPTEVVGWLAAGCRHPKAARALADGGINATHLVDSYGQPRGMVADASGTSVALAEAVATGATTVEQVVTYVQQLADTYQVYLEWLHGGWSVDVEGAGRFQVRRLADVGPRAQKLIEVARGQHANGIWLATKVSLPAPVQKRLNLVADYHAAAEQGTSATYRQSMLRSADAALCGAARELVGMGIGTEDIGALLGLTVEQVHQVVAGRDQPSAACGPRS